MWVYLHSLDQTIDKLDEIQRMKKENPEIDNKQLMSLAASRWKEHKAKTEEAETPKE